MIDLPCQSNLRYWLRLRRNYLKISLCTNRHELIQATSLDDCLPNVSCVLNLVLNADKTMFRQVLAILRTVYDVGRPLHC